MHRSVRFLPLFVSLIITSAAFAQSGVKVEVDDIADQRVGGEMMSGALHLRLKVTGSGLEKAAAARVIVKEAKDDGRLPMEDHNTRILVFGTSGEDARAVADANAG